MDLRTFAEQFSNNNDSQTTDWLRIERDQSVKIIIPRPAEGQSLIGVAKVIFLNGAKGGRTFRLTDQTYASLLELNLIPMKGDGSGDPVRLQIRGYINVLDLTANKIKVWETSRTMITRINGLDEDPDTPAIHECILKVSKRSKGASAKEVDYDLQVIGKAELTAEQQAICENLYDVDQISQPHTQEYILKFLGKN